MAATFEALPYCDLGGRKGGERENENFGDCGFISWKCGVREQAIYS